jgi:phosphogluconate dehydratase
VNHFHRAGGLPVLVGELLDAGLLHRDVRTVAGPGGLDAYRQRVELEDGGLRWRSAEGGSGDLEILSGVDDPFSPNGGLRLVTGRLGRAVAKVSAIPPQLRRVEAPARVFDRQEDMIRAFDAGELHRDVVVVVRFQGPRANGMPELHKLMPSLGVLQDRGHRVALVTDGRLSGASGKVPSAIHVTPEAALGGPLARLRDGDLLVVDPDAGALDLHLAPEEWAAREPARLPERGDHHGMGRELFGTFRRAATGAEQGATTFGTDFLEPQDTPPEPLVPEPLASEVVSRSG